jgi:hypothetical protein
MSNREIFAELIVWVNVGRKYSLDGNINGILGGLSGTYFVWGKHDKMEGSER